MMKQSRSPLNPHDLLALVNPPLVVSAAAECLAGAYLGGPFWLSAPPYVLALASAFLFAAGSVFGHYFDRTADAARYPDRPLASRRTEAGTAWKLGWTLLVTGAVLASLSGRNGALAGIGVAVAVVLYAAGTKAVWGAGFLTLAAARGLNLVLGLTASELGVLHFAPLAVPVMLYALGWSLLRASRQPGAPPTTGFVGLLHLGGAVTVHLYQAGNTFYQWRDALLFLLVFLAITFPRFVRAVMEPRRGFVLEAVQYGFIGLTLLEATLVAGQSGALAGLLIALFCIPLYTALRKWPISLVTERR
jgi:UbiA prenyltransferase family protein